MRPFLNKGIEIELSRDKHQPGMGEPKRCFCHSKRDEVTLVKKILEFSSKIVKKILKRRLIGNLSLCWCLSISLWLFLSSNFKLWLQRRLGYLPFRSGSRRYPWRGDGTPCTKVSWPGASASHPEKNSERPNRWHRKNVSWLWNTQNRTERPGRFLSYRSR